MTLAVPASALHGRAMTESTAEADPQFRAHYVDCPKRIRAAMTAHGAAAPRVIVDFGCGRGIKTLALANAYPGAEVVGIDITRAFRHARDFADRHLDGAWPDNLRYEQIEPGDRLADRLQADVICSWSVLEHVDRAILPGVTADMAAALAEGGIVISQIAPLYHSPFGSHLRGFLDEPWAHLMLPHHHLRARVLTAGKGKPKGPGSAEWMFARYEELNRITAPELFGYFRAAGLRPLQEDTRSVALEPPEPLRLSHDPQALRVYELFSVHAATAAPGRSGGLLGRLRR